MEKKNNNKNGSSQRRNQRPTYIGTYIGRGIIRVGNRLKNQYFFFLRSSALILNANRSTTPIVQRSSTE